jgi:hypothetical protein
MPTTSSTPAPPTEHHERSTAGREHAYVFAIFPSMGLLVLVAAAIGIALVRNADGDSPFLTLAISVGPISLILLGLILYGYISEHRSERSRRHTLPPVNQP